MPLPFLSVVIFAANLTMFVAMSSQYPLHPRSAQPCNCKRSGEAILLVICITSFCNDHALCPGSLCLLYQTRKDPAVETQRLGDGANHRGSVFSCIPCVSCSPAVAPFPGGQSGRAFMFNLRILRFRVKSHDADPSPWGLCVVAATNSQGLQKSCGEKGTA